VGDLFIPIWQPEYLLQLENQLVELAVWIPMPLRELYAVPLRELERLHHALSERIKVMDSKRLF
jgi:hypothetical protein